MNNPTCFFDTIECYGNCCEEGRLMLERYLEEKETEANLKLEYILEQAYILTY